MYSFLLFVYNIYIIFEIFFDTRSGSGNRYPLLAFVLERLQQQAEDFKYTGYREGIVVATNGTEGTVVIEDNSESNE